MGVIMEFLLNALGWLIWLYIGITITVIVGMIIAILYNYYDSKKGVGVNIEFDHDEYLFEKMREKDDDTL
jgi:hypothetical protein